MRRRELLKALVAAPLAALGVTSRSDPNVLQLANGSEYAYHTVGMDPCIGPEMTVVAWSEWPRSVVEYPSVQEAQRQLRLMYKRHLDMLYRGQALIIKEDL